MKLKKAKGTEQFVAQLESIAVQENGTTAIRTVLTDIAESKDVEKALREYEKLIESSHDMIAIVDREYRYRLANRTYLKFRGAQKEDLIGRSCAEVLGEDVFENPVKGYLDRCFEGETIHYETRFVYSGLGERDLLVSYLPIGGPEGVDRVGVVIQDVTEGKKTEASLEKSEQRYQGLFESLRDGFASVAMGKRIVEANPAFEAMTGYTKEELSRMTYEDLTLEQWHAFEETIIKNQVLTRGFSEVYEKEYVTKDGRILPVELRVHLLRDKDGNPAEMWAFVRDITERKRMEEELRRSREELEELVEERSKELETSEQKFRSIFENATEGIFRTTPEGRFLSANPSLAHILGYDTPEQLMAQVTDIGKQVIVAPDVRPAYLRILDETGVLKDFECKMRKADGTIIWVSLHARVIREENGRILHYQGTFQDITQRKLASEQLTMQRDLALRLANLSDFDKGLALILETALEVSGMESGAIYLREELTGDFELLSSIGISDNFMLKARRLEVDSPAWSFAMQGKSLYRAADEKETPLLYREGFKYGGIVPILREGQVIGSLNMASRYRDHIPEQGRVSLDFLSTQLGNTIARMRARQHLEKEVDTRREAEKALQVERLNLQETNAALKVLLRQREEDKKELEEKLVSNVKQLVLPYVEKLKKGRLEAPQETMVGFIETNLKEILSPFLDNVKGFNLTPRQLEIIALIKGGRTTKDIAELLHISKAAIDKQRFLIRKRLDLNNDKTNLRSYLLSLA